MKHQLLYRNIRARDNLEVFLVSAVSSLLLLRFFLHVTGYPQVGGGSLHIAHMLYGGLLMLAALTLTFSFIGARVLRLSALLGGIGFGIFIDEIGKFLTKDNDYFFRPAIGIIYAIFIVLYLLFNFLSRRQRLTTREYELNALNQFEEAVLHDLYPAEKANLRHLLSRADRNSPITKELQELLTRLDTVAAAEPNRLHKLLAAADKQYRRFWRSRTSNSLIGGLFILEAVIFLVAIMASVFHNLDTLRALLHGSDSYADKLIVGQLASSFVAAGFAIAGAVKLPSSRPTAFELFRRATLINLLLTEFFIFSRIQFGAIPSFLVNLLLLLALRYALHQEQRSHKAD